MGATDWLERGASRVRASKGLVRRVRAWCRVTRVQG